MESHGGGRANRDASGPQRSASAILDLPSSVSLSAGVHGRSIVAARPIAPGVLAFVEYPIAATLGGQHWGKRCNCCFSDLFETGRTAAFKCSGCLKYVYCEERCADMDWARHQQECGLLRRLPSTIKPEVLELLLLERLLGLIPPPTLAELESEKQLARARGDDDQYFALKKQIKARQIETAGSSDLDRGSRDGPSKSQPQIEKIALPLSTAPAPAPAVEAPVGNIQLDEHSQKSRAECSDQIDRSEAYRGRPIPYVAADVAVATPGAASSMPFHAAKLADPGLRDLVGIATTASVGDLGPAGARQLAEWLARFEANNFVIADQARQPLGNGIYPCAAVMNHSCDPNCELMFNPTSNDAPPGQQHPLLVVARRAIQPGEELTHAYVSLGLPYPDRQTQLWEQYRFHCDCTRCTQEAPEFSNFKIGEENDSSSDIQAETIAWEDSSDEDY